MNFLELLCKLFESGMSRTGTSARVEEKFASIRLLNDLMKRTG